MTDTQKEAIGEIVDEVIIDISDAINKNNYAEALTRSEVLKNLAIACSPNSTLMNWGKLTHIEAKEGSVIELSNGGEN